MLVRWRKRGKGLWLELWRRREAGLRRGSPLVHSHDVGDGRRGRRSRRRRRRSRGPSSPQVLLRGTVEGDHGRVGGRRGHDLVSGVSSCPSSAHRGWGRGRLVRRTSSKVVSGRRRRRPSSGHAGGRSGGTADHSDVVRGHGLGRGPSAGAPRRPCRRHPSRRHPRRPAGDAHRRVHGLPGRGAARHPTPSGGDGRGRGPAAHPGGRRRRHHSEQVRRHDPVVDRADWRASRVARVSS